MSNNVKRFGGELELPNTEFKTSTYKARGEFLKILNYRKPEVFSDLLHLFNADALPDESQNNRQHLDYFTTFFLRRIKEPVSLDLKWLEADIKMNIAVTPVVDYFRYLSRKKNKIKELSIQVEEGYRKYSFDVKAETIHAKALELLTPNWNTIQQDVDAEELCKSLTVWAEKYNICEDWILDFALLNLRKAKTTMDEIYLSEPEPNYDFSYYSFDHYKREICRNAIASYMWDALNPNPFEYYIKSNNYLPFEFKLPGIEINDIWMPLVTLRQEFVDRVEEEFFRQSMQRFESVHESVRNLDSFAESLREAESITEQFRNRLKTYCSRVLKKQPKEAVKTPVIKSGNKHFEWLVEFQIVGKSYEDIAKENDVDSSAVRYGVRSVSNLIDLKLRKSSRTGRPRGMKETKNEAIILIGKKSGNRYSK